MKEKPKLLFEVVRILILQFSVHTYKRKTSLNFLKFGYYCMKEAKKYEAEEKLEKKENEKV